MWWLAGLHYQYLVFGPGIAFLRFGPVWKTIYPLFVVLVIVDLGLTASRLIWPRWTEGGQVTRLVMSALGIIVLYFLIGAPDLFVASDANTPQLQALAKNLNLGVHIGLTVTILVNVFNVVKESARLIGRSLGRVHQANGRRVSEAFGKRRQRHWLTPQRVLALQTLAKVRFPGAKAVPPGFGGRYILSLTWLGSPFRGLCRAGSSELFHLLIHRLRLTDHWYRFPEAPGNQCGTLARGGGPQVGSGEVLRWTWSWFVFYLFLLLLLLAT